MVRKKLLKAGSIDTDYSEVEYEDHIRNTIDWNREKTILERKRKVTMMVIVLAFLVTSAVMIMSVVHVENNKITEFGEYSCPENNSACLRLLCQWQKRGEDNLLKCNEGSDKFNLTETELFNKTFEQKTLAFPET